MKIQILIFLTLLNIILAKLPNLNKRVLKESTLTSIKSSAKWNPYTTDENPFKNYSKLEIKGLLGLELTYTNLNIMMLVDNDDHIENFDIPIDFDSRKQWPDCITPIRTQQHCGSCWAFSAATVLSDRYCIASKGIIKPILSPQFMLSCDKSNNACNGGLIDKSWRFLEKTGTSTDDCTPYASADGKFVPKCENKCVDKIKENFKLFKAKKNSSKSLGCAMQIQREMIENSPVQTGFIIYEDFLHYKNGIYKYTNGSKIGGHAVRVIGWGREEGTNYWIVANSWGSNWGENGYFRIEFGQCLFEENSYSGEANFDDFSTKLFQK